MARKTALNTQPAITDTAPAEATPIDNSDQITRLESLVEALMVRVSNLETGSSSQGEADSLRTQACVTKSEYLERRVEALEQAQSTSIGATAYPGFPQTLDTTSDDFTAIKHKLQLLNNSVGAY